MSDDVSDTGKKGPPPETPMIGVDCKVLDFGKVVAGSRQSKTLQVRNLGTGVLMGKVSTSESWIEVSPQIIDVPGIGQAVTVTIDTSVLPHARVMAGYINIETNGGPANIKIQILVLNKPEKGLTALMVATSRSSLIIAALWITFVLCTIFCLFIEKAYLDTDPTNTTRAVLDIIDMPLYMMSTNAIAVSIPVLAMSFFTGIWKILVWDYSFFNLNQALQVVRIVFCYPLTLIFIWGLLQVVIRPIRKYWK